MNVLRVHVLIGKAWIVMMDRVCRWGWVMMNKGIPAGGMKDAI